MDAGQVEGRWRADGSRSDGSTSTPCTMTTTTATPTQHEALVCVCVEGREVMCVGEGA